MTGRRTGGQRARDDGADAAAAPVREHLLQAARAQADQIRRAAQREAEAIREQARQAAAAALAAAAADGQAAAAPLAAAELSRARAAAAGLLLHARREAYDELRRQARAGVRALPARPGYDRLAGRLARLAAQAAGRGAALTAVPGGVIARGPGVIVDCSADRLADLAVAALGAAVTGLWTP